MLVSLADNFSTGLAVSTDPAHSHAMLVLVLSTSSEYYALVLTSSCPYAESFSLQSNVTNYLKKITIHLAIDELETSNKK